MAWSAQAGSRDMSMQPLRAQPWWCLHRQVVRQQRQPSGKPSSIMGLSALAGSRS